MYIYWTLFFAQLFNMDFEQKQITIIGARHLSADNHVFPLILLHDLRFIITHYRIKITIYHIFQISKPYHARTRVKRVYLQYITFIQDLHHSTSIITYYTMLSHASVSVSSSTGASIITHVQVFVFSLLMLFTLIILRKPVC